MLMFLGTSAREVRQAAAISTARIAAEADVADFTIRRFEAGQSWPKGGPDHIIAVYAQQCGVRPVDIWRRAVDLLAAADR